MVPRGVLTQAVRAALTSRGWMKRGLNVTSFVPELWHSPLTLDTVSPLSAVHTSPEAATALDEYCTAVRPNPEGIPAELAALLNSNAAQWLSGLRARCAACRQCEAPWVSAAGEEPGSAVPVFDFIELFAGIGGFRVPLDHLGGSCVFASEIAAEERKTYQANFGESGSLVGDITEIDAEEIPDHQLLTAGFPCQSFSIAGSQKGLSQDQLFFEVIRVLAAKQPVAFLLENVENLLRVDGGRTLELMTQALTGVGYTVGHRLLNARRLVPQARERVYLIGFLDSEAAARYRWPLFPSFSRCVAELLHSGGEVPPGCELSDQQWRKVREREQALGADQEEADLAVRRMVAHDGTARTLMASYRQVRPHSLWLAAG